MHNFNRKSINHAEACDISSHSLTVHSQFVLSLLAAEINLINQQFATV